jgi:hypothetical protein
VGERAVLGGLDAEDMDGSDAIVLPVQAISLRGSTTSRLAMIEPGRDFQRKAVPGRTGLWSLASLTSGFPVDHSSIAEITENAVCGSAPILT